MDGTMMTNGNERTVILRNWYLKSRTNSHHVQLIGHSAENPADAPQQFEFVTSVLKKRIDKHRMQSGSGTIYAVQGPCDLDKMQSMGYPKMFIKVFSLGFPTEWKEFLQDEMVRRMNEQTIKRIEEQKTFINASNMVNSNVADARQWSFNMVDMPRSYVNPAGTLGAGLPHEDSEPVFRVPAVPKRARTSCVQVAIARPPVPEKLVPTTMNVEQSTGVPEVCSQLTGNQPQQNQEHHNKPVEPAICERVLRKRQFPAGAYAVGKILSNKHGNPNVVGRSEPPVKKAGLKDATNKNLTRQVERVKTPKSTAVNAIIKDSEINVVSSCIRHKSILESIEEVALGKSKPVAQRRQKQKVPLINVVQVETVEAVSDQAETSMIRRSSRLNRNYSGVNYVDFAVPRAKSRAARANVSRPQTPETVKKAPQSKRSNMHPVLQKEVQDERKNDREAHQSVEAKNKKGAKQPSVVISHVAKRTSKKSLLKSRSPITKKAQAKSRVQPPRRSTRNFCVVEESDSEEEPASPRTPPIVQKKPKRATIKPSATKAPRFTTTNMKSTPVAKRVSMTKKKVSAKKPAKLPAAKKTPVNRGVGWWRNEIRQVVQLQHNSNSLKEAVSILFVNPSPQPTNLQLGPVDWAMDDADDFEPMEHTDTTRTFRMSAHLKRATKRISEFDYEPSNAKSAMERLNFQGYLQNEKQNAVKNRRTKLTNSSIWSTGASASATLMNVVLPSLPAQLRDDEEF